jgi:hypothetical protein
MTLSSNPKTNEADPNAMHARIRSALTAPSSEIDEALVSVSVTGWTASTCQVSAGFSAVSFSVVEDIIVT